MALVSIILIVGREIMLSIGDHNSCRA